MGLFDSISKMFGRGASAAEQQPNAQQRFEMLKQKYQTALNVADQQRLQFHNLQLQDDKLYVRATAPSEDAREMFWQQIRLVNPNEDDIHTDILVDQSRAQGRPPGVDQAAVRATRSNQVIRCRRSASSSTVMLTSICASSMLIVIS